MNLQEIVMQAGAHECGVVKTADVHFAEEVRKLCADNVCRKYGTSWACPPGTGTVQECKARCLAYENMLVFTGKYDIEDSFDFEGMGRGHAEFSKLCERVDARMRDALPKYQLLAHEGCDKCERCTYPDAPCRFPDRLHHSVEAYGIYVNELAGAAGVRYINGANTVTYFGAVLYDPRA